MASLVRATGTIGGLTLVSRILGLVRDQLFALVVGAGLASDCFLIAFRLPNLFRALFAEGAFSAAFVPMFSRTLGPARSRRPRRPRRGPRLCRGGARRPAAAARRLHRRHGRLRRAGGVGDDRRLSRRAARIKVALAIEFTRITFPYLLLISLVSLLGGILNSIGRFWVNAAAPILLNVALIVGLAVFHGATPVASARVQSAAVTVAGMLQFVWLIWACHRAGIDLRLRLPRLSPPVRELLRKIGPAALGAGAVQINLVISTSLAARFLGAGGDQLSLLRRPAQPAAARAGRDRHRHRPAADAVAPARGQARAAAMHTQNRAIELVLLLTLPAASALVVSALPIVRTLFEHGRFTAARFGRDRRRRSPPSRSACRRTCSSRC